MLHRRDRLPARAEPAPPDVPRPVTRFLTVRHITTYRYQQPVAFGEHRLMFRPRDSYDQRLLARLSRDHAGADDRCAGCTTCSATASRCVRLRGPAPSAGFESLIGSSTPREHARLPDRRARRRIIRSATTPRTCRTCRARSSGSIPTATTARCLGARSCRSAAAGPHARPARRHDPRASARDFTYVAPRGDGRAGAAGDAAAASAAAAATSRC